ncbi:hypothetical protein ACOSQ3_012846 [Xanthoceras sorbifolium]
MVLGFNLDSENVLSSFTSLDILNMVFTYILFLFLMGVKMDVTMIHRTGKKDYVYCYFSLVAPFLHVMVALERVRELWELNHDDRIRLVGVVVTQSLSTFPAIACIINELEILNSVLRRLGISCALVGDMISQFLFGSTIWVARIYRKSAKAALIDLATMTASVAVVVFAIRPTMLWVVKQTHKGRPVKSLFINNIIILALGTGLLSHLFRQYVLFRPFWD